MTPQEIQELFTETITKSRGLHNKVNDYSKDAFYNWRTGRTIPKLSEMLSILYQLNLITVQTNG